MNKYLVWIPLPVAWEGRGPRISSGPRPYDLFLCRFIKSFGQCQRHEEFSYKKNPQRIENCLNRLLKSWQARPPPPRFSHVSNGPMPHPLRGQREGNSKPAASSCFCGATAAYVRSRQLAWWIQLSDLFTDWENALAFGHLWNAVWHKRSILGARVEQNG